jgi:hypothetical protein
LHVWILSDCIPVFGLPHHSYISRSATG